MMEDRPSAAVYLKAGKRFFQEKNYGEAILRFRKLIIEYPDSDLADNAHYNLGVIYSKQGDYSKSFVEYKTILERYPDSDAAVWAPDMIEELKEKIDPSAPLFYKSQELYRSKRHVEAEEVLNEMLEQYPDSDLADNAHFSLGMIRLAQGRKEEALSEFEIVKEKYAGTDAAQLVPDILAGI